MNPRDPNIVDITVKGGGFPIQHRFLETQIEGIATELQRAGVTHAEISHGMGLGSQKVGYPGLLSDEKLLQIARRAAPRLKIGVYISSSFHSIAEIEAHLDLFDFGRVGVNPDETEKIWKHLTILEQGKKFPILQLLRVHRFSPEKIAKLCSQARDHGAQVVYLSDTYGSMGSEDIEKYFETVAKHAPGPLGFQGSNATGRAMDNTLCAYRCGAKWLDASLSGLGPGNGYAVLEILVALLQNQGQLSQVDLTELSYASRWQAIPAIRRLPRPQLWQLLFAKHRIDYYPEELIAKIGDILEIPEESLLQTLQSLDPEAVELREPQLRDFLRQHQLDFEVVLHYLKTGEIPT